MLWKFKAFGKGYVDSDSIVEADLDLPHARDIDAGDLLVRVDASGAITAVSAIIGFDDRPDHRPRRRCALCDTTNIDDRGASGGYCKGARHKDYRQERRLDSSEVVHEMADVTRRSFTVTTEKLTHPLASGVPETLVANRAKQQSIRPLEGTVDAWVWTRIPEARPLLMAPPEFELPPTDAGRSWADKVDIEGGRTESVVRRRRNQGKFRKALLSGYGARCAVLGPMPEAALDAAHIVPFAEAENHAVDSGLLLAADIHRLFDRGLIAFLVYDSALRIELSPSIRKSPRYASLHGSNLHLEPSEYPSLEALASHAKWAQGNSHWASEDSE